jgi:hypothetical protein
VIYTMSVFELSLWMDPCNEKSLADCNSDMSFVLASTLQELISEGIDVGLFFICLHNLLNL